jgi:putative addiction module killer protein
VEVRQHVDSTGRNQFARWFVDLPEEAQARIVSTLGRLGNGNTSSMKGIGSGLFEIRVDYGPGYRVYCGRAGESLVILLGGGTKKRQQADIWQAHALWEEYKRSKRERN